MNKKLIISDLDGTLLNNKSELSKTTVDTIKEIIKQGHVFCISTGRPYRSAINFYNQLGLNTVMSLLNGSCMLKPNNESFMPINLCFEKHILEKILENKTIKKYVDYIIVEDFNNTYGIDVTKSIKLDETISKHFHLDSNSMDKIKSNNLNKIKNGINSILIVADSKYVDEISFKIKSLLQTLVVRTWNIYDLKQTVIEVNSRYANKGSALKFLSSYYGVPFNEIYVFGDGDNDMDMMKLSSKAFAMKNSVTSVKLLSYKITNKTNDEDGVALALQKEFKIKTKKA